MRVSVCVCLWRQGSEIQESQLKEEKRPPVTDLDPVKGLDRGKKKNPVRYRAVEGGSEGTTG